MTNTLDNVIALLDIHSHTQKISCHVARTNNSECQAKGNAKCQEVYTKTKIPITE